MRFSTSTLLGLTTYFALVSWCLSNPLVEVVAVRLIIAMLIVGAGSAICYRGGRPHRVAAIAGFTFVVLVVAYFWIVFWIDSLFHEKPYPYFEDGRILELYIYPVVYCVVYGPIASAIAGAAAISTMVLWHLCSRLKWKEDSVSSLISCTEAPLTRDHER